MLKHTMICIGVLLLKISLNLIERVMLHQNHKIMSSAKICFNQTNRIKITENDEYYMHVKSINFIKPPLLLIIYAQSKYLPDGYCKKNVLRF